MLLKLFVSNEIVHFCQLFVNVSGEREVPNELLYAVSKAASLRFIWRERKNEYRKITINFPIIYKERTIIFTAFAREGV